MSPAPAHEPFLRAICEAPDDDAPRLVFADWLDENGDPERAEFIRQHVQLARQPEAAAVDRRCAELFQANRRRWVAELPGPADFWAEFAVTGPGSRDVRSRLEVGHERGESVYQDTWVGFAPDLGDWARGFPAAVCVQGGSDLFLTYLDVIMEFVPVRKLHLMNLNDPGTLVQTIAGHPFLAKLRDLILPWVTLTDDAAVALAGSPFATGLRQVSLIAERMTDRAGRAFAESPYLRDVDMLLLLRNEFNGSTRARLQAKYGFRVYC